jgi:GNAT superfamily N-acetyltransferase
MDEAINISVEVLSDNDIEEYSKLMVAVMEEFNQEDINGFQYWFTSVEGINSRRRWSYDDDYDTVQFVAKYSNEIIGALEIESKDLIQSFFVKKEYQNKGVGRTLLQYSLDFFRRKGEKITSLSVFPSTYAKDIYQSLGFEDGVSFMSRSDPSLRFTPADIFYIARKYMKRFFRSIRSNIEKRK